MRILGVLLSLATIALVEVAERIGIYFPNPPAILMMLVVFSTFTGGVASGVLSTAITCGYLAYFYADPAGPHLYTSESLLRVTVATITTPAIMAMAAMLRRRGDQIALRSLEREKEHSGRLETLLAEKEAAEKQLRDAKEAAEQASGAKSTFLANMSHEIRTPMNGVIGMAHLALQTELTRQQREYLEIVCSSAESLLDILNDLLDFSRIEAGKLELVSTPFELERLVHGVVRSFSPRAEENGIDLAYSVALDLPRSVNGDESRLRQVLVNLISNAVKFTSHGHVVVRASGEPSREKDWDLVFTVEDTGLGVPTEKQNDIFEPFTQADGSSTRRLGGTGLGLAISNRLVEMMGGKLDLVSSSRSGSSFRFFLRMQPYAIESKPSPIATSGLGDGPLLVVGSPVISRKILIEQLEECGLEVMATSNAQECVDITAGRGNHPTPSGIVVDLGTAEQSFRGLLDELIEIESPGVPLVFISNSADQDAVLERCRGHLNASCISRPIHVKTIVETLRKLVGEKIKQSDHPSSFREPMQDRGIEVLVAEDNAINRLLLERLLTHAGYGVTVVHNGADAVELFEAGSFDLVLLDWQMPVMDGLQAARAIRTLERGTNRHTPLVAITAHALRGDRERCLAVGFDGYIPKPIRVAELLATLEAVVPNSQNVRVASVASAERSRTYHHPVNFEEDILLQHAGGDLELARELAEVFVVETPEWIAQLQSADSADDGQALRRLAHMIKGAASQCGGPEVRDCALRLERLSSDANSEAAATAVGDLTCALEELQPRLKAFVSTNPEQGAGSHS